MRKSADSGKIFISSITSAIIIYLSLLYLLTLTPFRFSSFYFHQYLLFRNGYLAALMGKTSLLDIVINLAMLIPFGFLGALFLRHLGNSKTKTIVIIAGISFMISVSIETLQLFLPRMTSGVDILNNTISGMIGAFLALKTSQRKMFAFFINLRTEKKWIWRLIVATYFILLIIVFLLPSFLNTLENWDESYHLLLGNEGTRDRPWSGTIYALKFFDRSLDDNDVKALLYQNSTHSIKTNLPVPLLEIDADDGKLMFQILDGKNFPGTFAKNFLEIKGRKLVRSVVPPVQLIRSLKQSKAFTIYANFSPASMNQTGPARIVSLSSDPINRNFTLGQVKNRLNFRVRTPLTGANGSKVSLFSDAIVFPHQPNKILATFNRGEMRIYKNGKLTHPMIYDTSEYLPLLIGENNDGHVIAEMCFFLLFPFGWIIRSLFRNILHKYAFTTLIFFLPFFLSTAVKMLLFDHFPDVMLLIFHIIIFVYVTFCAMLHDLFVATVIKN